MLRGGAGKGYDSSIKKGGEIISHITENLDDTYKTFDILVDKDHIWHLNGVPVTPGELSNKVDLVWNTTHPSLSSILESLSIPNIGASSFAHTLENNKDMLREHLKKIGLNMPRNIVSPKSATEVFEKFGSPWIVKNDNQARIVKTFPELADIIDGGDDLVVEEFISGKIASIHSVPDFRDQDIYIFPLGNTYGIFSAEEKEKLSSLVRDLHEHIGAKHYLKSDFILNPHGRVYLLSIESVPDLKPDSHFSQVCLSIGAEPHEIISHILEQAIK